MSERACTKITSAHAKTMYLLTASANSKQISQIDKRSNRRCSINCGPVHSKKIIAINKIDAAQRSFVPCPNKSRCARGRKIKLQFHHENQKHTQLITAEYMYVYDFEHVHADSHYILSEMLFIAKLHHISEWGRTGRIRRGNLPWLRHFCSHRSNNLANFIE